MVHAPALFSALWMVNISTRVPYQPMTLSVAPALSTVAMGARNCPDNTANKVFLLNLASGAGEGGEQGVSQICLAPNGKDHTSVAGVGWSNVPKQDATNVVGPNGYHATEPAEPSYGIPSAITNDGALSAYLIEPNPDEKHINNRSAALQLVCATKNGTSSKSEECYRLRLDGNGAFDPWSVSTAAHSGASGAFTVAATMGLTSNVVDFDPATKKGSIVWSKQADPGAFAESAVAVSSDGSAFAVTNGGSTVDVWGRGEANGQSPGSTKFSLLGNIPAPDGLQPMSTFFSREEPLAAVSTGTASEPFLAVAWVDASGSNVAVTAHLVSNGNVSNVWSYERACPGDGSFDYVVPNSLAVTGGGEYVAFGTWGCLNGGKRGSSTTAAADGRRQSSSSSHRRPPVILGGEPASASPNVVILKGRGGDGKTVMQDRTPGEVWAVGAEMDSKTGVGYVGVGSWSSMGTDAESPPQVRMFSTAK